MLKIKNILTERRDAVNQPQPPLEPEKSDPPNMDKVRKPKSQVPKLNIQSLQSLEFLSPKVFSQGNFDSAKASMEFQPRTIESIASRKLITDRTQQSDESPMLSFRSGGKQSGLRGGRLDCEFLSHREHNLSSRLSHNPLSSTMDLRKPIRGIHPNSGEDQSRMDSLRRSIAVSKEKISVSNHSANAGTRSVSKRAHVIRIPESFKENVNTLNLTASATTKENNRPHQR